MKNNRMNYWRTYQKKSVQFQRKKRKKSWEMKRTQVKYHLAIVFNEKKKEIRQEYMKLKEKHDEIV